MSDFYFTMFCILFALTLFLPGLEVYSFGLLLGWACGFAYLEGHKA